MRFLDKIISLFLVLVSLRCFLAFDEDYTDSYPDMQDPYGGRDGYDGYADPYHENAAPEAKQLNTLEEVEMFLSVRDIQTKLSNSHFVFRVKTLNPLCLDTLIQHWGLKI